MDKREFKTSKEATWRNHLARHAASGKSIAVFCRNEAISHADQALDAIAALFKVEQQIRNDGLRGQAKRERRQKSPNLSRDRFFAWIGEQFDKQGFLPSGPFPGALAYIRERRVGLSVYLDDPDVSIDTNHLERSLRVIPTGKKNWLFSWTELGAKHIGIVQSLLATCHSMTATRMTTSSTYCSASASTRRHWCISSRRASGSRCSPPTRCAGVATNIASAYEIVTVFADSRIHFALRPTYFSIS